MDKKFIKLRNSWSVESTVKKITQSWYLDKGSQIYNSSSSTWGKKNKQAFNLVLKCSANNYTEAFLMKVYVMVAIATGKWLFLGKTNFRADLNTVWLIALTSVLNLSLWALRLKVNFFIVSKWKNKIFSFDYLPPWSSISILAYTVKIFIHVIFQIICPSQ